MLDVTSKHKNLWTSVKKVDTDNTILFKYKAYRAALTQTGYRHPFKNHRMTITCQTVKNLMSMKHEAADYFHRQLETDD